jgi:acyl carrier protein
MNKSNTTMEQKQINESLRQFILEHFPSARRRPLGELDPLLQSGIIDSLGVLDVVTFIEEEFKVTVDDQDLTPENFQSISQIAAFVETKKNQ